MIMPVQLRYLFLIILTCFNYVLKAQKNNIDAWLTNNDRTALFEQQASLAFGSTNANNKTIMIDETRTFQQVDGCGVALTGGRAMHISRMSASARNKLLHQLFDTTGNSIGV